MEARPARIFYRATKRYPPTNKDYITRQERLGDPPEDEDEEVRKSWDALSFFDSVEALEQQIREIPAIGRHMCRYRIPENAGITWEASGNPGHFDLRGDKEVLKECLVDCVGYVDDI
ncbi:MAG: hypothetical protein ACRDJC_16035 [Thermomicrobiales bacterium]